MEWSSFLFYSDFHLIEWGPLTFWRAICFIRSIKSHVNFIQKHSHRCTQKNVWTNIWAHHGPCELTRKFNHHNFSEPWMSNDLFTMSALISHRSLKFNLLKNPNIPCLPNLFLVKYSQKLENDITTHSTANVRTREPPFILLSLTFPKSSIAAHFDS